MDSKTRSKLAGMAQKLDATFQIGKNGLSDTVIFDLSRQLEAKELVKINLLKNSELDAKEVVRELCEKLSAEPVSQVGFKIVLYRRSKKKDVEHILKEEKSVVLSEDGEAPLKVAPKKKGAPRSKVNRKIALAKRKRQQR